MASNNVTCIAERSACLIRATRLGSDCTPLTGATDGALTTAIATINLSPDVEEGTKYEPKDACGRILYSAADPDVVKRYNITIDLHMVDFEMYELLTDGQLLLGKVGTDWAGQVVGVTAPGPATPQGYGVGLEIWTKTASDTGVCGPASTNPPFIRHVLPRVLLRPADRTFEGAPATNSFAGVAEANVSWGEGPWGDWMVEGDMPSDTPWARFYDSTVPAGACGFVTPGAASGS
jgi:hypothetical protein